ncbi:helix-turn-helix domain-containing protein [Micromonospora sp. CB01531]|uniref:helix-turn-helix domain-containing protein n=1 Tax=Micromonospora sp. CB01531 TaxID=1718947 RepID=UPI00093F5D99
MAWAASAVAHEGCRGGGPGPHLSVPYIAETTLRRWVSKGRVPCHRLGRKVRFTDEDLEAAYQACPALAGRR